MTSQTVTERPMDDKPNPANGRYGIAGGVLRAARTPFQRDMQTQKAVIAHALGCVMLLLRQDEHTRRSTPLTSGERLRAQQLAQMAVDSVDPDDRVCAADDATDELVHAYADRCYRDGIPPELVREIGREGMARFMAILAYEPPEGAATLPADYFGFGLSLAKDAAMRRDPSMPDVGVAPASCDVCDRLAGCVRTVVSAGIETSACCKCRMAICDECAAEGGGR
jgi:hypothetical protein